MEEVIPFCISEKVSEESASTLKNMFDNPNEDTESHLAMVMIEMTAVGDGLLPFCEICYTLEGDGQLILRDKSVFDRLDAKINEEWSSLRMTDNFITKVVMLFQVVDDRYCGKIESARNILNETCVNVNSANEKLDHTLNQRNSVTSGGVSRSGRQRTNSGRVTDIDQLEMLTIEIAEAKCELRESKKIQSGAKKDLEDVIGLYDSWKLEFPSRTHDTLIQHAEMVLKPAHDYYKRLFREDGGDCCHITKMAEACDIFNPLILKDISETEVVTKLYHMAEKLKHFKYDNIFTDSFISRLKKEMPDVVKASHHNHDLDGIEGSRQYFTRMQRRMKRYKVTDKNDMDWKKDEGEYAHRIWEWWIPRVKEFPCHALALRLVVLAQMSSCSVERVFSRLKVIRERCGDNLYEDMLEIRLFLQCNGDLNDLHESLLPFSTTN
jgi:hypothetical protein